MNKFFTLTFMLMVFLFFAWVFEQQSQSAENIDPLAIALETRSRAIQSGNYDYNADSYLPISTKEEN